LPMAAMAGPVAEKLADRLVGSFAEELLERDLVWRVHRKHD
jgi:hypothetical protein